MIFFFFLDDHLVSSEFSELLVNTIEKLDYPVAVAFENLERYSKFDKKLFEKVIKIIYRKNQKENLRITVWGDLFSKKFEFLGNDLKLIKSFYILQNRIQDHFDFDFQGLNRILDEDQFFLVEYVDGQFIEDRREFIESHRGMGFIWRLSQAEEILDQIFDLVRNKGTWFGIREHYCNTFFKDVREEHKKRAEEFLINYIRLNSESQKKVNEIIDIIRHSRKEIFNVALETYLELNQNLEDFTKISWIGNGGVYTGNVIIGDLRAASWKDILSTVNKSSLGIKILPIKKRLNEIIEGELRSGDMERKRRFLDRYP